MTIDDVLAEIREVEQRFWFVQRLAGVEQTDVTIKARLEIHTDLFVHVFFSERSGRLQLALVKGNQRLYGRDREGGQWHLHPYGTTEAHQPTPEGVSPHPLLQFMSEVEGLLLEYGLI